MNSFLYGFLIPFIIALLSGMGVGGGGLFMIYLTFITQMEQMTLQGINLIFFLFASGASLILHLQGRKIYFGAVAVMIMFGVIGSVLGSMCASLFDGRYLRYIFAAMLIASGIYSFFSSPNEKEVKKRKKRLDATKDA